MAKVVLKAGEVLTIEFDDADGQFEVHFDSPEHKNAIVIKESAGLRASTKGKPMEILYEENFGDPISWSVVILPANNGS